MSKAEHMGVSPSIVSGQTGNDSCPKQTTSEQTCQFCAECAHSEPLEVQHHLPGSEAIQNKPQEISTAVATSHTNDSFPPFSGDVPDKSLTKHLVLPPVDASKSSQTKEISRSQQSMLEQTNEFGSECIYREQSEKKNKLDLKIVLNESAETSTVKCSSVDNENLQPVPEDVSKSNQSETKQTLEFGSGHRSNEQDAGFKSSELSEQKYQLGSRIIQNEPADTDAMAVDGGVTENLQSHPENVTKICHTDLLQSLQGDMNSSQNEKNSCAEQPTAGSIRHEPLDVNEKCSSEHAQNKPGETSTAISCSIAIGKSGSPSEVLEKSSIEHLKQLDDPIISPSTGNLAPFSDEMVGSCNRLETPPKYVVKNSSHLECRGRKASKSSKKKYMLRSSRGSDRVLRSRSQEKPKASESSNKLADIHSRGRKRIKNQNRRGVQRVPDEYSRIRTHLRYLLNRINYEQSLISAYSGEGWKGLSIEKLKPEKELQRATSEILRRKLKIRDLFQRLDSLCAEGQFPESLFDSDGQIDSEDIFCAKCGSKDLTADDDIILCDGACDRGFHQYCLEPPLLKEDIPADEEGWLCPGCDCKVDCIDMVNDSQGTNLFIADTWEKVFPEAAAAGHNQDPNFGLPSDESDDNDYDPDGPASDEKDQGDETSSDESDFTSASDELEASAFNNKYLGLPSDDSDDDDFNPEAPVLDEKVAEESSSSDFISDSEDLAGVLEDKGSSGNDEEGATSISPLGESNGQRSKCAGNKGSLNNELLSMPESGQDGAGHVYEKRSVERLDYKKLYDETYGHVPSDSSDDEDWTDNDGPRKRTKRNGEGSPVSANGNASVPRNGKHTRDVKQNLKETAHTPSIRTHHNLHSEDKNTSAAKSHAGSSTRGSSGRREKSSYRRLGEDVTKRLYNSFMENQYPDRTKKESLANELGITISQVSKWFENARWSFRHSSSMDARLRNASVKSMPQSNEESVGTVSAGNGTKNTEPPNTGFHDTEDRRDVRNSRLAAKESNPKKITTPTSSKIKRKGKSGHEASDPESQIGYRPQTRRKKSVV